ncbi:MAG: MFS transporter, partial [Chloroflexi bacterium]|nr:MFS transporter [Chloroflexota bacterium]
MRRLSWRGANTLFFVCSIFQSIADGHTQAFTPLLLHGLRQTPSEVVVWTGLLAVVSTGMAVPMTPFWGVLAERLSRRNIILRSYVAYSISLLLMAWAPDVNLLVLARAVMGLGAGTLAVIVAVQSMLVPRRHLGPAIALVQSAMPIGISFGPPLGALAIPYVGLRWVFVADAAAMMACSLVLLLLMPEPVAPRGEGSVLRRTAEVVRLAWRLDTVRWNFICAFSQRAAASIVEAYLPVRITQLAADPVSTIGWVLGIYGACTGAATWAVGRLVHRVDEATISTRAMLFGTVVTAGMAVAPTIWLLGILAVLRAIPVAFSNTVLHSHNARVIPAEHRTAILGLSPVPRYSGGALVTAEHHPAQLR